ncbi:WhiB family transcriptional regulator [Microbacterium gorillae]|uniref:WhiB family transcriptional regulator n=1 Tax=Microbacterium gorillae TaxID=1231063 RepID=UPI0038990B62
MRGLRRRHQRASRMIGGGRPSTRSLRQSRALHDALHDSPPPCTGDTRFTHDEWSPTELTELATICHSCPVRTLCRAFADAERPTAGYWAGKPYPPSKEHQ